MQRGTSVTAATGVTFGHFIKYFTQEGLATTTCLLIPGACSLLLLSSRSLNVLEFEENRKLYSLLSLFSRSLLQPVLPQL